MAIFIIDRPFEISWSRNIVRYGIHTDTALTTIGLGIAVKLKFKYPGDVIFRDIVTHFLTPDSSGNVFVDISLILDSLLTYQLPDVDMKEALQVVKQVGEYYIEYREVTSTATSMGWISEDAAIRKVIKGGIAYESWKGGNYFSDYLPATKTFVTWQPSGYLAGTTERLYLHCLIPVAVELQLQMKIKVRFADGVEQEITKNVGPAGGVEKYSLYLLVTGFTQLGLDLLHADKPIAWWEIRVVAGADVIINPYRYILDYRNVEGEVLQFSFFNSLGGMDSIRIRGNWETQHIREIAEVERTSDAYYYNAGELPAMVDDVITKERMVWKGDAGYMSRVQQDRYRDLFLSRKRVAVLNNRWVNARILNKTTALASKEDGLFSLQLEWCFSYDNINYTPANINMALPVLAPAAIPHNLRITSVTGNQHTLEWDAADALAHEVTAVIYDRTISDLFYGTDDNMDISYTVQNNLAVIDLSKYRKAIVKVRSYGNGYITPYSADLSFPIENNTACPVVTNVRVGGWDGNLVTIQWDSDTAAGGFEIAGNMSDTANPSPIAPQSAIIGEFTAGNQIVFDTQDFRKIAVSIKAICAGTNSTFSASFSATKP